MTLFLDLWKKSPRSRTEQLAGLGILLLLNIAPLLWNSWINQNRWIAALYSLFYLSTAIACWVLWRRYSIRTLVPEISLYLSQFPLQILWALSSAVWSQVLVALMLGLLQVVVTFLAMISFWKKDRLSGHWMVLPFFLSSCALCINLEICLCC